MAFLKQSRPGRWEIRESRVTPAGPRSRTLATFASLDHSHLVLAESRAQNEFDESAIIEAARRIGVPVRLSPADAAGTELLRALGDGHAVAPGLRQLLLDALTNGKHSPVTEEALGHVGKSAEQRGAELVDLMLLGDAIPSRATPSQLTFPVIPAGRI
ncbi:MAG: hypothetical protein ACPGYP_00035 [Solirubrobacterales bacterium]